ncbi:LacI family DNA-binding transcriptional regulator [uncultured Fusobacterium sp.]|uniref:LacI family DNA-binding transcriptional regulator n=1 Tax=uncultured Fusobacterium sp. TaxID=159267 RepID=UPI0025D2628B|nr:LacI family DNA-binding transcriptional regulator [uncultured Fusobacterium sp.]
MKMKDIAKELGLSIATVSRVVNGHENVSEETKKKVQDFIEKKNYTPNVIAQNLSKMENKTVALLVPNISNPFFATLINYICKNFNKCGYQIALYNTVESLEQEKEAIKNIMGHRIAGVIAILIAGEYEVNPLEPLLRHKIPVYLLDREFENSKLSGVFLDNYKGAYNITRKLLESGHRDIALITGNLDFLNARERMKGYIEAHRDFQVEFKEENIYEGDYLFESGYEIGKKLLETSVSAVFSSNNLMLCGVLKALKEREKEIQLACFEKTDFFQLLNREIISCSIPLEEMGEKIYELFINKSKNKKIYIEPILS